jgi:cell division protein FtsQ
VGVSPRLRLSPRGRLKLLVALAFMLMVLVGGWLWLRDSSLVGVKRVAVVGASGPDASQIRSALRAAGRHMTTLDVQMSKLHRAVARFSIVKDLQVSTQFPHGLKINVIEQIPVATVASGTRRIAVTGDGVLLRDVRPSPSLPVISVRALPHGRRLSDRGALRAVSILGGAPYQLLSHVGGVTSTAAHGIVVELRQGPSLYFGDPTLLRSKWTAAVGVLADAGSAGASYIDVVDPERPAAGSSGAATASSAAASSAAGTPSPASAGAASPNPGAASSPGTGGASSPAAGTASSPAAGTASSAALAGGSAPAASNPSLPGGG